MTGRMNISIPDDLKERMDKVPNENWSKTAVEAFEKRLEELSPRKERTLEQFAVDMYLAEALFGWKFARTHQTRQTVKGIEFIDKCRDDKGNERDVTEVPGYSSNEKHMKAAIDRAWKTKKISIAIQASHEGQEKLIRGFKEARMLYATADTPGDMPDAVAKILYRLLTGF